MAKKKHKKSNYRDAQLVIIMGRNGTGKSTFCEKIIKALKLRTLVITLNGQPKIWRQYKEVDITDKKEMESFKGIRQVFYMRKDGETMKHIYKNYHNGIIVFDDCRGYLSSNIDYDIYLKRILMDFRHKMLDLFFVCHTPKDVPARLWGFYSTAFIGATKQLLPSSIACDDADEIIAAQRTVNRQYSAAFKKNNASHYGIFKRITP